MITVKQAKQLCISAHQGQFRKDKTTPYHTHPIAVADMMDTEEEKIIAYLHDVIEDTIITGIELQNLGVRGDVLLDIYLLTKKPNQLYSNYLLSLTSSSRATKIKIADMLHNMSCNPSDKQKAKYLKALPILLKAL